MYLFLALWAISLVIFYSIAQAIYRLYFSPIAQFPGPKLAAASWLYQFYYDVVLEGQYMFKIQKLHRQYGPVIRINPYELHVIDPEFLDVLYTGHSHKRDKWAYYTEVLGTPGASMNTKSHDLHRTRRSALNPFFSKASIRKLQPLIDMKINQLLERFGEFQQSGEIVVVNHASSAFTNDVVTEFCFGKSHDRLNHPKFDPSFHDNAKAGTRVIPFLAFFPFIWKMLETLPKSLTSRFSNDYAEYLAERNGIIAEATKAMESPKASFNNGQNRTIFHEILDSKLPLKEKALDRLADEAAVTLAAGTLTTAWVLSVAIYFLIANPSYLERLKTELETSIPDPSFNPSLASIETLPYLRACIQEALRLGYGAPGRVCHIAPDEPLVVKDLKPWIIPPGTPTTMTVYLMNHNESIFPDSKSFLPERWLENPRLDKYLFSFSKGSRQCAGINLAYAELTLAIAKIFRNYGSVECRHAQDKGVLALYNTSYRDVECVGAMILPKTWDGTKGVRIHVMK